MHILVVDDDVEIGRTLRRGLSYEGYQVTVVTCGDTALEEARHVSPDVILLDRELPDFDGLDLLSQLRRIIDVAVIVQTAHGKTSDKIAGLDRGADDYVVKPYEVGELAARIRAVIRRSGQATGARALQYAGLRLDAATYEASYNGQALELVGKEFSILEMLLRHPGQVLSRDSMYEHIWGLDGGGSSIEVFISCLRRKLKVVGAHRLLQTVRGAGYVLREAA